VTHYICQLLSVTVLNVCVVSAESKQTQLSVPAVAVLFTFYCFVVLSENWSL